MSDKEEYQSRVKKCLDHFAGRTTLGTVIFMKEAVRWWYKLFWILIFLGGVGASTYNVYLLIDKFFQYPVDTQVTLSYEKLPFPSVTVCNINPVRKSAVQAGGAPAMNQFVSQLMPKQNYKNNYMPQPNSNNSNPVLNGSTNSNNSNPSLNITTYSIDPTKPADLATSRTPVITHVPTSSPQQSHNGIYSPLFSWLSVLESTTPPSNGLQLPPQRKVRPELI